MKTDFLKKRAESFLKDANFAISEKRWNSAAFHLEQTEFTEDQVKAMKDFSQNLIKFLEKICPQ
jgi:hypothetical protein